jgi:hypothetical protein
MQTYQRRPPNNVGRWIHRVMLGLVAASVGVVAVALWSQYESQGEVPPPRVIECKVEWFAYVPRHPCNIPNNWTHRELLDHLKMHGVEYVMFLLEPDTGFGPTALFVVSTSKSAVNQQQAEIGFRLGEPDVVLVHLRHSADESMRVIRGTESHQFLAGRFLFMGKEEQLTRIRNALP